MKLYSFVETATFTRDITQYGSVELLFAIQNDLLRDPTRGDIVPGTNGARKARVADPRSDRGKREGYRYLYLYLEHAGEIYLLFLYRKKEMSELSQAQKETIARWVGTIKKGKPV